MSNNLVFLLQNRVPEPHGNSAESPIAEDILGKSAH
jgi:hypothetical protein